MNIRQLVILMIGVLVITPLALIVLAGVAPLEDWAGLIFPVLIVAQVGFLVWYARRGRAE